MKERIKLLETEMESLSEKISEIEKDCISKKMPWDDYMAVAKPYNDAYDKASMELRTLVEPKMKAIPNYGDHMTLEEFIENVNDGGFIDYDGSGHYATETEMSDISIYPSDIEGNSYRKDFTHIVWFNR